jgi:uncharacterized FlgJ-related protein
MKNLNTNNIVKLVTIIFMIIITVLYVTEDKEKVKVIVIQKEAVKDTVEHNIISKESLMNCLNDFKVKFPHIVLAQAVLESGHFKSDVFLSHNNLFGMKIAGSRPTTALNSGSGYAKYESWMMSVLDYALFQSAFMRKINTEAEYFKYLAKNYAQDPGYISKLKEIASEWNQH